MGVWCAANTYNINEVTEPRFRYWDPVHKLPGVFENGDVFSEFDHHPHVAGVFGHQKQRFSNTLSGVEIFENGDVLYSFGWAKTEVFKYDDVMPRILAGSSAHTTRKYVRIQILLNTQKRISVFENTRLQIDRQIQFKNATCRRRVF